MLGEEEGPSERGGRGGRWHRQGRWEWGREGQREAGEREESSRGVSKECPPPSSLPRGPFVRETVVRGIGGGEVAEPRRGTAALPEEPLMLMEPLMDRSEDISTWGAAALPTGGAPFRGGPFPGGWWPLPTSISVLPEMSEMDMEASESGEPRPVPHPALRAFASLCLVSCRSERGGSNSSSENDIRVSTFRERLERLEVSRRLELSFLTGIFGLNSRTHTG
mmetsp:Transcript_25983/g.61788  ORF Transcript_25983/g.61788 Transcript_25983/m.61788 type:complete len:222 (-) Transcript_25983:143-808(-)